MQYEDIGQLCRHPRAKAAVLAEMDALGREAGVGSLMIFSVILGNCSPFLTYFDVAFSCEDLSL